MTVHVCDRGQRFAIHDARGIFCCYACPRCEREKRSRFRAEVFTDPNYAADEPIEDET